MSENESFEALRVENPKPPEEEEEEEEDEEEEELEESEDGEEEEEDEVGGLQVGEFRGSGPLKTLAAPSSRQLSENGLQGNSTSKLVGGAELKDKGGESQHVVLASVTAQPVDAQTKNQFQFSVCPTSSELSPTSVTQPISSLPSPTLPEQRLSQAKSNNECVPKKDQQNSSDLKPISVGPAVKTPSSDGYNWRKYGQKQVKSPKGSRSYYKCTFSECYAKKIECSDHSGHVIEIVYKSQHSHDPPRKFNCTKENKLASSAKPVIGNGVTEHPIQRLNESEPPTSSKETIKETPPSAERKRQNSSDSDGNCEIKVKEEHVNEPEPKRRQVLHGVKKSNVAHTNALIKPGKKPKFVVHAAGDVGISGDGYRWRKYGQKMVKGNPHPRNYYRCTSAGCPVRKHIETAVDNVNAVIITYKGVHDHDMPVPKKRHGPPSAPLVAAAAPASMNVVQFKKTDTLQNQVSSTQWSVDTEGELTGEAMELGGEKAMESARTLLSIGFEIKPC
uniref:WRKY transcription factor 32 n=1 Tax=Betula platyphylla TaxID=78630 RepID=A0AA50CFY8_BETPL|nr:WRKY transcription factor 32 [Betula platyphylla]